MTPQLPLIGPNVVRLTTKIGNNNGYRLTNLAPAVNGNDAVTLSQLQAVIAATGSSVAANTKIFNSTSASQTFSISVNTTLAIGSDLADREFVVNGFIPTTFRADVKQAPTGAALVVNIYSVTTSLVATLIGTLTIPDGSIFIVGSCATISGGTYLRLDITAVGTTYPGSSLTVTIS